jgi:hypothetical protein
MPLITVPYFKKYITIYFIKVDKLIDPSTIYQSLQGQHNMHAHMHARTHTHTHTHRKCASPYKMFLILGSNYNCVLLGAPGV